VKNPSEQKVWGEVQHVFDSETLGVSILKVEEGTYCSRHRHHERINRFIGITAVIAVVHYEADGKTELSRASIGPGGIHDVPVGVYHRFEVIKGGHLVEVYYPPLKSVRADDIERLDVGGKF
jgi:hypothetical protein